MGLVETSFWATIFCYKLQGAKRKKNTVIPRTFLAKIAIEDFISALHFGGAYQRFSSLTAPNEEHAQTKCPYALYLK